MYTANMTVPTLKYAKLYSIGLLCISIIESKLAHDIIACKIICCITCCLVINRQALKVSGSAPIIAS